MEVFPGVNLNDTISFQVYPAAVIGTIFNYCKITAVLDYDSAKLRRDVDALHENCYPTLPASVPDNPRQYFYLKVQLGSGEEVVLGQPYIDESTIKVLGQQCVRFTVENIQSEDLKVISNLLASAGYSAIDWELG